MLVSGKNYLDLDQVERDFCSARQYYAHAQQEKLQKKETSAPVPKKYLEYGVSQEELLWEVHRLKPPTLARIPSNHLHKLFYDRRSW